MPLFSFEGKIEDPPDCVHRAHRRDRRRRDGRGARLGLVHRRAARRLQPDRGRPRRQRAGLRGRARHAARRTTIGAGSTVGHNCTIHAATLGEECLIGNGATVLDGARIGVRAMVARAPW